MQIGLQIVSFKYPGGANAIASKLKEIITFAEDAGFYSAWVMDHYYQIQGLLGETYNDPMLEAYTTLGFLAGLTHKIRLGVLVTGVIYRPPGVLLKAAATLDILAEGRTYLGIGAGWYAEEANGFGIPYPTTSQRFEQLEDTLQMAHTLWSSGEASSFSGTHVTAPKMTNNPPPISTPHPRILVGGMGPRKTLRMVAQYADACNLFDAGGPERQRQALETLRTHCEALGRDYDAIEKTSLGTVHFAIGEDTPAGVIDRLHQYAELGFTHAIFNFQDVYDMQHLQRFAEEVLPAAAAL